MIQPIELRLSLPMRLGNGVTAPTTDVWQALVAARQGAIGVLEGLVAAVPLIVDAQYNYMPPIHLAVREGHVETVRFLLDRGARYEGYDSYPYRDSLITIAEDREHREIARLLRDQSGTDSRPVGARRILDIYHIEYPRDPESERFQKLVDHGKRRHAEAMLEQQPDLARDETAFWFEGIMSMPSNSRPFRSARAMLELLYRHGARVPDVTKWAPQYYFKYYDNAELHMAHGMNARHMNCHHVTLLHEMAYMGQVDKARLLLDHGAELDALDEEFLSTPLGLAARWGKRDTVRLLLDRGADPNKAGAHWATPLAWARKKGHADIAADLRRAGARDDDRVTREL